MEARARLNRSNEQKAMGRFEHPRVTRRYVAGITPRTARSGCGSEELVVDVVGSSRLGVGVGIWLGGGELLVGLGEAAKGQCAARGTG